LDKAWFLQSHSSSVENQLKTPAMEFEHKGNTGNRSLEAGFHGMDAIRVQLEASFFSFKTSLDWRNHIWFFNPKHQNWKNQLFGLKNPSLVLDVFGQLTARKLCVFCPAPGLPMRSI
jgi:hypothetical protein